MPAGHVLFGRTVRAIGRRQDCDDVLFYLGESVLQFAVVHLTDFTIDATGVAEHYAV
jgi:hypothetical protein